ncbi:hypothetical protein IAU59_000132 [Kwoniella sp. CBS 9459]
MSTSTTPSTVPSSNVNGNGNGNGNGGITKDGNTVTANIDRVTVKTEKEEPIILANDAGPSGVTAADSSLTSGEADRPMVKAENAPTPLPLSATTFKPQNTVDLSEAIPPPTSIPPKVEDSPSPFPGQLNAEAGPGPTSQAHHDERASALAAQREAQAQALAEVKEQLDREREIRKRKWGVLGYADDEIRYREGEVAGLHTALMLDQYATLYPPPPTAFTSYEDVIDRLLPYHVWQIHDEELEGARYTEADELREMQEAKQMVDRIRGIKERFAKTRRKEGDYASSLPITISLLNDHTSTVREEFNALSAVLRPIKAEYQALESEAKKVYEEQRRVENEKRRAEEEKIRLAQEKVRAEQERVRKEQERVKALAEDKKRAEEKRKRDEEEERLRKLKPPAPPPSAQNAPGPQTPGGVPGPAFASHTGVQPPRLPTSTTSVPNAPSRPTSTPSTLPLAASGHLASSATATASPSATTPTAERGRPRGRPRGRGRGGMRETTSAHVMATTNGSASTPTPSSTVNGMSGPGTTARPASGVPAGSGAGSPAVQSPGIAGIAGTAGTAGTAGSASTAASALPTAGTGTAAGNAAHKGPVQLTVSMSLVPQLVALGLVALNPQPNGPKLPAHIIRTSEDKRSIILWLHLSACSKTQLIALAKLLNVDTQPPVPGAKPSTTPSGPSVAPTTSSSASATATPVQGPNMSTPASSTIPAAGAARTGPPSTSAPGSSASGGGVVAGGATASQSNGNGTGVSRGAPT